MKRKKNEIKNIITGYSVTFIKVFNLKIDMNVDFSIITNYLKNKNTDEVTSSEFVEFCLQERFLPDNKTDIYWVLSILNSRKILTKIKNGKYQINSDALETFKGLEYE